MIPKHIAEVSVMPPSVLSCFERGGFTVNLKGTPFASLGIDESLEGTMNRLVKMAIRRGNDDNISKLAMILPVRGQIIENLKNQLGTNQYSIALKGLLPSMMDLVERNISCYYEHIINQSDMFSVSDDHFHHVFSKQKPSDIVESDMLQYCHIGQQKINDYLGEFRSTSQTMNRVKFKHQNLQTFAEKKKKPSVIKKLKPKVMTN